MKILAQFSCYQCAECGSVLMFADLPRQDIGAVSAVAVGWYANGGYVNPDGVRQLPACPRYEVRLRVPLNVIECELAETLPATP